MMGKKHSERKEALRKKKKVSLQVGGVAQSGGIESFQENKEVASQERTQGRQHLGVQPEDGFKKKRHS